MAFDFQKAINGEPIYLNGIQIDARYSPMSGQWMFTECTGRTVTRFFDQYGKDICHGAEVLSTDPPKKKVMVTAYVYKDFYGELSVANTKITNSSYVGEISGEVEI
jgi:hypothetical protein